MTSTAAKVVHYFNPAKVKIACGVKEHSWTEWSTKPEEVTCGRCRQVDSFPTVASPVTTRYVEPRKPNGR
jgi:hypothetical protein